MADAPIGYTPNINLKKFAERSKPGATQLNENWTTIDNAFGDVADELNTKQDIITVSTPLVKSGSNISLSIDSTNFNTSGSELNSNPLTVVAGDGLKNGGSVNLGGSVTIDINYNTTNLKSTSGQINTIQDINTTASPTFANLTVDNLYINNEINQVNQTVLNISDKKIILNNGGDNLTSSGSGITVEGTSNVTASSFIFDSGIWNLSHDFNLASGKNYRSNNIIVIDSNRNISGSNALFSGELTFNGTTKSVNPFIYTNTAGSAQSGKYKSIQLSTSYTGTLIDNGILFGTDSNLYRFAANTLKTDGNLIVSGNIYSSNANTTFPYKGYYLTPTGSTFEKISATELHVKNFIADLEQALVGSEIICKSAAKLADNITIVSNTGSLKVEEISGYTGQVYANNDYVLLTNKTRNSGSLSVTYSLGKVTYVSRDSVKNIQTYNYFKLAGSLTSAISGSLGLDYGVNGDGIIQLSAISELNNKANIKIGSFNSASYSIDVNTQLGDLTGITENVNGIIPSGNGFFSNNAFLKGGIIAEFGKIGGWNVDSSSLYSDNKGTDGNYTTSGLTLGSTGYLSTPNTFIKSNGQLVTKSGSIAAFDFNGNLLSNSTYNINIGNYTGQSISNGIYIGNRTIASTNYREVVLYNGTNRYIQLANTATKVFQNIINEDFRIQIGDIDADSSNDFGVYCANYGNTEKYFKVTNNEKYIAGWMFDSTKFSYSNNVANTGSLFNLKMADTYNRPILEMGWASGSTLASTGQNYITLGGNTYTRQTVGQFTTTGWDTSGTGGGLAINVSNKTLFFAGKRFGVEGAFIAGWSFDENKFYNNNVRLESTSTLSGLAITSSSKDVVKIGNMSNTTPPNTPIDYTSTYISDPNFNGSLTLYTGSLYATTQGYWYTRGQITWHIKNFKLIASSSNLQPAAETWCTLKNPSNLNNKTVLVEYDIIVESNGSATETPYIGVDFVDPGGDMLKYNQYHHYTENGTYHIAKYVTFGTGAYKVIRLQGGSSPDTKFISFDNFTIKEYPDIYTNISQDGLEIYKSPIEYFKFKDNAVDIAFPKLNIMGDLLTDGNIVFGNFMLKDEGTTAGLYKRNSTGGWTRVSTL